MTIRILFVTSFPPFPVDRGGGAIRSRLLLDALRQCGRVGMLYLDYRGRAGERARLTEGDWCAGMIDFVDIVPMARGHGGHAALADRAAQGMGMMFGSGLAAAGLRVSGTARRAVDALVSAGKADLIVGRLSRPTAVAGLLDERRAPLIVDADDWEPSRIAARLMATPRHDPLTRAWLGRYRRGSEALGARLLDRAEHVWLASRADTARIARAHATTLPNLPLAGGGGEIAPLPRSDSASRGLFAVGQWSRAQNSDGMGWFLRHAWPIIRDHVPAAELRIGGAVPDALARDWRARPGVQVLGFLDDLRGDYARAALVVTPMTWGGGTKIKVLEALAHGRVPAGPRHAFDGLADGAGAGAVMDDDAAGLARAMATLLVHPDRRHAREQAAIDYYRGHYSLAAFQAHVRDTVHGVVERRGGAIAAESAEARRSAATSSGPR
jgi:hypothetical protein